MTQNCSLMNLTLPNQFTFPKIYQISMTCPDKNHNQVVALSLTDMGGVLWGTTVCHMLEIPSWAPNIGILV